MWRQEARVQIFRDYLHSLGAKWKWEQLNVDGNDCCSVAEALRNGTAIAVTDTSYHRDKAPSISGAGWIILNIKYFLSKQPIDEHNFCLSISTI